MKTLNILIADDDPVILMILRQNLQPAGFEVHQAASGAQAVDMAARRDYDAIVLDVNMPGLNGLQAAHAIRDGHPAHDLPIILMSARPDASSSDQAIGAGADAFLSKPFRSRELAARIQTLREHHATPVNAPGTTTTGAADAALPSPTATGAAGAAPVAPVVVVRAGAPAASTSVTPAVTPFKPRVLDALPVSPVPIAPTTAAPVTTAALPDGAIWIDLDPEGHVGGASVAAVDALHMPSFPAGMKLDTFLNRTHELVPSVAWSELSTVMQNGFLRVISPRDSVAATHRAYEVQVERTRTGCRLWLADVTDSLLAHAAAHTHASVRTQP